MVHVSNKNGLTAVCVVDEEYPSRSAFCVLGKMIDEFEETPGSNWRATTSDSEQASRCWGMGRNIKIRARRIRF